MPTKNTHFVNPYSFIRIPKEEPKRTLPASSKGTLSGYIDCSLEIVSPTFIPNTTKKFEETVTVQLRNGTREARHPHRVFCSYADLSGETELTDALRMPADPIIPGSELRGMTRNLFEQFTNSCFSQIDEFNLPYKRTPEPKVLCLMYWNESAGTWLLYPEQSLRRRKDGETEFGYAKGVVTFSGNRPVFLQKGWADVYDDKREIDAAYRRAYEFFGHGKENRVSLRPDGTLVKDGNGGYYLHLPAKMNGKTQSDPPKDTANRMILYAAKADAFSVCGQGYPVSGETLTRFERVLGLDPDVKGGYRDPGVNGNYDSRELSKHYAKRYAAHLPLAVYADKNSVDGEFAAGVTVYLSPASMTKEFFGNKILDILEQTDLHQPCRSKKSACPACRLFGMVGTDGAVKGRLRFADSHKQGEIHSGEEVALDILGAPHISSTEFYLLPPANWQWENGSYPGMWNYDYALSYEKTTNDKGKEVVSFIRDRQNYRPVPAGRKFYWRHDFPYVSAEKTNMNSSVTPIVKGAFGFRVYYDSLTETELKQLLFCLRLNDDAASKATVHRIGGGKPLGMGQCRVTVNSVIRAEYVCGENGIVRTETPVSADCEEIRASAEARPVLIAAGSLPNGEDALVSYPLPVPSNNPNRREQIYEWFSNNRTPVNTPMIEQILPEMTDETQLLKKNRKRSDRSADSHGGGSGYNGGGSGYSGRSGYNGGGSGGYGTGRSGWNGGSGGSRTGGAPQAPAKRPLRADTTGAKCLCCGGPVRADSAGKPFPLCQSCNNKKASAVCAACGEKFTGPEYYAKLKPALCPDCRKKK